MRVVEAAEQLVDLALIDDKPVGDHADTTFSNWIP
jgi:hypothetical protein